MADTCVRCPVLFMGLAYTTSMHMALVDAHVMDWVTWLTFFSCVTSCLAFSAAYHLLYPYSQKFAKYVVRLDYSGIIFMITGSFFPVIYFGALAALCLAHCVTSPLMLSLPSHAARRPTRPRHHLPHRFLVSGHTPGFLLNHHCTVGRRCLRAHHHAYF